MRRTDERRTVGASLTTRSLSGSLWPSITNLALYVGASDSGFFDAQHKPRIQYYCISRNIRFRDYFVCSLLEQLPEFRNFCLFKPSVMRIVDDLYRKCRDWVHVPCIL